MSEPHSSSSIQICLCIHYSPRLYFVRTEEAQKRGISLFPFVLHIAIQAFLKPPLMSWPQCCKMGERSRLVKGKRVDLYGFLLFTDGMPFLCSLAHWVVLFNESICILPALRYLEEELRKLRCSFPAKQIYVVQKAEGCGF